MLKELFYLLIPDNIKNIEIYKKIIDIFIDNIEEKSSVSIDINNIFRMSDENFKLLFMETYAKSFYEVLKTMKTSNLMGASELPGMQTQYPALPLHKMLTPEQIQLIKKFGENKGSRVAIEFVNNLIESLNTAKPSKITYNHLGNPTIKYLKKVPFNMETTGLFHYKITGNLSKESYEKFVKPLAHPVGFVYEYVQGPDLDEEFSEVYRFKTRYNVAALTVLYANSQKRYSYIDSGYEVVNIQHEIIPFKNVDFHNNLIIQNELLLRVTFENGNYLDQRTRFNVTTVIEYDSDDNIVKDYSKNNDNVYIDLEFIEDDTYFPDVQFSNKLNYKPAVITSKINVDPNAIPIYGAENIYYGDYTWIPEEATSPNIDVDGGWSRLAPLFVYGQNYSILKEETFEMPADEYINILLYCKDNSLDFKMVRT